LDGNPFFVNSTLIHDGQVIFTFHNELGSWLADTKVTLVGRNLFDKNPPYAAGGGGNSTGYPSFLKTSEGRFW
jgi:hypothetical protein